MPAFDGIVRPVLAKQCPLVHIPQCRGKHRCTALSVWAEIPYVISLKVVHYGLQLRWKSTLKKLEVVHYVSQRDEGQGRDLPRPERELRVGGVALLEASLLNVNEDILAQVKEASFHLRVWENALYSVYRAGFKVAKYGVGIQLDILATNEFVEERFVNGLRLVR